MGAGGEETLRMQTPDGVSHFQSIPLRSPFSKRAVERLQG